MPPRSKRAAARANPRARALNALTTAENDIERNGFTNKRNGKDSKNNRNRSTARRNVREADDEDNNEDEHHVDEMERGSDSEGNTWKIGQIDSDDDSELDSDEAMGESDEERFSEFTFRGSSTRKNNRSKDGKDKREDDDLGIEEEDDNEDENDDTDEEGGMDLAQILDQRMKHEAEGTNSKKRKKGKTEISMGAGMKRSAPVDSEEEGESDEEHSGEAASSNDGNSFNDVDDSDGLESGSDDSNSDAMTVDDSADEDANTADLVKLDALHELISSLPVKTLERRAKRARIEDPNEGKTPSAYNISLSSNSHKLTIKDLLPSINDPALKKSLKVLASDGNTKSLSSSVPSRLSAPLPKRQQDKLDRAVAFEKTKETLGRWTDTVKHNREADHLLFPLPNSIVQAGGGGADQKLLPVASSKPLTSLESTIAGLLKQSGLESEKHVVEFEQLKTNKLSVEEVQKRTAQLRLARELMYREEIKAKRLKKIKSKSFRRIHRKEREKQEKAVKEKILEEGGEEALEEDEEGRERRRAEERMNLRHKQSRFAKDLRQSGRSIWDDEAREGAIEAVRRGEELQRIMKGKNTGDNYDSFDDDDDESEDIEADTYNEVKAQQKLLKKLESIELRAPKADDLTGMGRLMQMKFMQNAEAVKRKTNTEIMQQLRDELDYEVKHDNDEFAEEQIEEVTVAGRRSFKPTEKSKAQKSKIIKFLDDGFSLGSDGEAPEQTKDDDEVEFSMDTKTQNPFSKGNRFRKNQSPSAQYSAPKDQVQTSDIFKSQPEGSSSDFSSINPWFIADSQVKSSSTFVTSNSSKTAKTGAKLSRDRYDVLRREQDIKNGGGEDDITIEVTAPQINTLTTVRKAHQKNFSVTKATSDADSDESNEDTEISILPVAKGAQPGRAVFQQRDLLRRAFAGDDVVREFADEKRTIIEEDESKEIDVSLPGWGAWSGSGISKSSRKNKKTITKHIPGVAADSRKDTNMAKVIINEKRVKKNAKYQAIGVPFPYESREQYERAMRQPIGPEWTTKRTFQHNTMPRVLVKKGTLVEPMVAPMK